MTVYDYTADGQLSALTYPIGRVVTYTRNLAGNVTAVSETDPQGLTDTLADQITYKPFGPMTGLTYGNGLTLTRSFNQNYQMTGY